MIDKNERQIKSTTNIIFEIESYNIPSPSFDDGGFTAEIAKRPHFYKTGLYHFFDSKYVPYSVELKKSEYHQITNSSFNREIIYQANVLPYHFDGAESCEDELQFEMDLEIVDLKKSGEQIRHYCSEQTESLYRRKSI